MAAKIYSHARAHTLPPTMGLRTWLDVVDDVLLQRWHTRRLPSDPASVCGPEVKGKVFIVTGPTSGIGTTTAETLARLGAKVVLACRTVIRGEALVKQWQEASEPGSNPLDCEVMHLDLDSLQSVRTFAQQFLAKKINLNCLINNAGVFDMSGLYKKTKDGHEQHWGTNYLAPALLALLLMPALKQSGDSSNPSRVVFVCSKLHEFCEKVALDDASFENRKYGARAAYAQSKLAELLFAREMEKRLLGVAEGSKEATDQSVTTKQPSVRCLCVHPGNIITGVVRTLPKVVQVAYKIVMGSILLTPAEGARASLYAATNDEALAGDTTIAPYFESQCVLTNPSTVATNDPAAKELWDFTMSTFELDDAGF